MTGSQDDAVAAAMTELHVKFRRVVQILSTTCNGSTITGIGRDAARRIWYRALTTYFTSGTTYAQARTATIRAAGDLFGAGSTQAATVAAAWSAVSVS